MMGRYWISVIHLLLLYSSVSANYQPTWESLDSRPLPQWYDEAKIGVFVNWGVYSVPGVGSEWFWHTWKSAKSPETVSFMEKNYRPGFTYRDFAKMFTGEFYNPFEWADIFNASGAQYLVIDAKHHDGYAMWPSDLAWNWNVMDIGPKRDVIGSLKDALFVMANHMHFGIYHSLYEWYNPLYLNDKYNMYKTQNFVTEKCIPELRDLVEKYKPELIWSDGDWEAPYEYWTSREFLAWLFNDSPVKDKVVVNDRWGWGTSCKHGSYYTCQDRYNPGVLQSHKFENALTLDRVSWGYRRNAKFSDYLTIEELLETMAETVSCGGNFLINVGPTHDGMIPPIMEERLRQMGQWLSTNGEAIYASKPWTAQNDTFTSGVWYTAKEENAYAIILSVPMDNKITLGSVEATQNSTFSVLGKCSASPIEVTTSKDGLVVQLPDDCGEWAWVLKMTNVMPKT